MLKRLFAFFITISLFTVSGQLKAQNNDVQDSYTKIGNLLVYINDFYVDTLDIKNLSEKAVLGIVQELDPHSSYVPANEVAQMSESLDGEFDGVGVEFAIINDTLTVQATIFGGPAAEVGVLAGDKIIKIDDNDVAGKGISNSDVRQYLRGKRGTKVNVEIIRKGSDNPVTFVITRDKIPLESVDAAFQPSPGVYYIKLGRFAKTSPKEIYDILAAEKKYPKGVILDLRGNSGGYLGSALEIANFFLKKGEMILYTEGAHSPRKEEYATGSGIFRAGPLVVMVDENSASASEIVAGALQDWDRAVLVGRKTFGKGLVQRLFLLNDDSQIRLTIARYHTPCGRVIQSPYIKGHKDDYYKAFLHRFENGESFVRDSIHFPDSLKYKTLRLGKTVYGGGGIMPEIFVPRDTSYFSNFYSTVLAQGVISEYTNRFVDENREELEKKYSSFELFDSKFSSDSMLEGLVSLAASKKIIPESGQLDTSGDELKLLMKALVARTLFGKEAYFKIINKSDNDYKIALEIMNSAVSQIDGR